MLKYEKNERMHSDLLGHILDFEYLSDIVIAVPHRMIFGNRLLYMFKEEFICLVNTLEVDVRGNI